MRALFPYQRDALEFARQRDHMAWLFQMRMGKTLADIRWKTERVKSGPQIAVSPLTVISAWENELSEENEEYRVLAGVTEKKALEILEWAFEEKYSGRRWVLTNFEKLLSIPNLAYAPWQSVAIDESTRIKNPKAQITKTCLKGFRSVPHRSILTGLISPEGDENAVCQMLFLVGDCMGHKSFWTWRHQHMYPDPRGLGFVVRPASRKLLKAELSGLAYVVNRRDHNVGGRKVYEKIAVPMPPELKKIYDKAESEWVSSTGVETNWRIVVETWLGRIAGGFDDQENLLSDYKYVPLFERLGNYFKDESVVVWFRFNAELRFAESLCKKYGISHTTILGSTPYKDRAARLSGHQSGRTRVGLFQVQCAKYGVDCSRSDQAIYYSNSCSAEARAQSEDRIINPRKNWAQMVTDICGQKTIDEDIVTLLRKKLLAARLFQGTHEFQLKDLKRVMGERRSVA